MDVVWMEKLFNFRILKNNIGQSAVEYILLLAVISSLSYTVYNNKKFKSFLAGKDGMFAAMKKGISYSYRYGLEYSQEVAGSYDEKMQYEYTTNAHDTYFKDGSSRFFTGVEAYPKNP
jgi:hypothetical protein